MAAISFSRPCSATRLISQIIKLQPVAVHLSTALIFFLHGSHFHHSSNVISQWVTGTAVQTPSVMYCGATVRKLESPLCGKHLHSNHWVWNWFYLSGIGTISCGFPLPVKCSFYNLGAQGMLMAFDEGPTVTMFSFGLFLRKKPSSAPEGALDETHGAFPSEPMKRL